MVEGKDCKDWINEPIRMKSTGDTLCIGDINPSNPLLNSMDETFKSCYNTAVKKNHDYGGNHNNPFANFLTSESITGVAAERGILVRLGDKFSRISTLLDKQGMVADESIDDTIMDAINYLAILKALRTHTKTTK